MRDVAILAYPGCMGTGLFALADVLMVANHLSAALSPGRPPPFDARIVGVEAGEVVLAGGAMMRVGRLSATPDVLLVPGLEVSGAGQWDEKLAGLRREIALIRRHAARGAEVATVCIGSFLLAEAGLLAGRRATTGWPFALEFSKRYPDVLMEHDAVLVRDGQFSTTGAVTAAFDLATDVVRRTAGDRVAAAAAKFLLIGSPRSSQAPYVDSSLIPAHVPRFAADVNAWLRERMGQAYDLDALARTFNVSSRTLLRRYTKQTGQSPLSWLKRARVAKARRLLEQSRMSLPQVVEAVGYSDVATFSRLFAREVGETPAQYRRRYSGRAVSG
ncbi:GlxA family transcriptional regulator [Ramlibacter sp. WS9]|uniref:GlxA family transcriptional regulator n=1 Tax=Ramlibacter sp. WS9 TaxID=1882741 RepID=UPI0011425EEB|nr:helix-turn-helix domain-containing protein [Ramlibacter sp. WS9]ROZ78225.1 helix-turn-helix domain-containing protein [Ramlibacter sp. WS9]